jgi:hypothetical protein
MSKTKLMILRNRDREENQFTVALKFTNGPRIYLRIEDIT